MIEKPDRPFFAGYELFDESEVFKTETVSKCVRQFGGMMNDPDPEARTLGVRFHDKGVADLRATP